MKSLQNHDCAVCHRYPLLLWFLILSTIFSAEAAQDLRIVNGKTVDLAPIHQWFAHHDGERPMKHWKRVQVFELKSDYGGYRRCVVAMENGDKDELLIAHLPPEVGAFLQSVSQQEAAIESLRQQIEIEDKRARDLDALAPTAAGGTLVYVDAACDSARKRIWPCGKFQI